MPSPTPVPSRGSTPLTVAVLNDYEVVVRGVHAMLAPYEDRVQVVELGTNVGVEQPVDVTLYDTFAASQVDSDDIDEILESDPGHLVVYSWNAEPALVEVALAKGCRGYLDKSLNAQQLVRAIERVGAGEIVVAPEEQAQDGQPSGDGTSLQHGDWPARAGGLSAREAEVVALITQGLTNQDIAERTYLSINSVKTYIRTAYRKMGVERRSQAVRWGIEHGMGEDVMRDRSPEPEDAPVDTAPGAAADGQPAPERAPAAQ